MSIALRFGLRHIGGAVIGGAVGAMHYTGIAALRAPADFAWNPIIVGISVAVGVTMAAAAIEFLGPKPGLGNRIGAVLMLVLAIVGLHFTGMAALTLTLNPNVAMPQEVLAPDLLAIAVAAVTAIIITLGLAGSFVDNRLAQRALHENERLQRRVEERTAELRQVQSELLRNERLSALGQLTATMAHELRNPMGAISNTIYTLKRQIEGSALDLGRPLARIERSIGRCERIINDLLDFTRLRALESAPVAVNAWLAEVLDEQKLGAGIDLERRFSTPDRIVSFDGERMRRVIINLIENAAQALAEPLPDGRERRITVATRIIDSGFELTVDDNGPGIPADIAPKVFEPLFSTKSFGTGLGLPMVKQIVEQHGGSIAIDGATGLGTRVAVRLPLARPVEMAA